MKILLSIKPEFVEKIRKGEKKFEFRRSLPKKQGIESIVVYASSPISKVVGEIIIDTYLIDSVDSIWQKTQDKSGLTHSEFVNYFHGKEYANAISIKKYIAYEKPVALKEIFPGKVPPQSFCYIEDNEQKI